MKIAIILGTRPEIIKMSPIIRECEKKGLNFFILHSGQHYSPKMDQVFFRDLNLPKPKYNLEIHKKKSFSEQVSKMRKKIEEILIKERVDIVLVEGDTNTVLVGSLAAKNSRIKIGHVEAGLRSNDLRMPEEINRIIVDNISDFLFVPTEDAKKNLDNEGIKSERIFLVGNTIVDSVIQNKDLANEKGKVLRKLKLEKKDYILVTSHRAENVDVSHSLRKIIKGVSLVQKELSIPLIFPIHPRTKERITKFNIKIPPNITLIEPLGFLEFLQLEANAKVILTDSGGVQEEACILKVPCVTMRVSTERPETLRVGANIVSGINSESILRCTKEIIKRGIDWDNPFGDGNASKKILNIILEREK